MNKLYYLLLSVFLMFSGNAISQNNKVPDILPKFEDTVMRHVDSAQVISANSFQKIIDKAYNSIATGQGQGVSMANFGSIDPVAGTFSLNYYTYFKNPVKKEKGGNWYLSLSAGGGLIGNNSAVLFNNTKFNSGMNITGKLFLPLGNSSIVLEGPDAVNLFGKKQALEYQRWVEKENVWRDLDINNLDQVILNYNAKMSKANLDYKKAKSDSESVQKLILIAKEDILKSKTDNLTDYYTRQYAKYSDSIIQISNTIYNLDKLKVTMKLQLDSAIYLKRIIQYDNDPTHTIRTDDFVHYGSNKYYSIDLKYDSLRDSLEINVPIKPHLFKWLALVGSFNRNNYYTFYDSLPFSSQLAKNTYSVFNYGFELNLLKTHEKTAWFLNIGFVRIGNNNISDLSTTPLTKQVKTTLVDTTQTLSKTYNVYTDPITEYKAWKLYTNYYLFFTKNNRQALHLSGDVEFRNTNDNPVNAGLGYIFSFKNSKDNSVVNVEAYVKFMDIFKTLPDQVGHFYNRITAGLTFGIPVNLPPIK